MRSNTCLYSRRQEFPYAEDRRVDGVKEFGSSRKRENIDEVGKTSCNMWRSELVLLERGFYRGTRVLFLCKPGAACADAKGKDSFTYVYIYEC